MEQVTNNADQLQTGNIRLYLPGGAGIGIGKYFEADRGKREPGYAALHPAYLDTSNASAFGVPEQHFFHLKKASGEETDGSGGIRSEHAGVIIEYTGEILEKFPPMDMNIVVASTTGGSGSTYAPSIVSELLLRDKPVIVLHVGSDDTLNYIKNTISVMAGYESTAKLRNKPVVLSYFHNGVDGTVEEVDAKIQNMIACLTVLYSRQNRNMDSRDLYNWLFFNRKGVTSFDAQVAVLKTCTGALEIGDAQLISLATLNDSLNNTRVEQPVEFQRVGIPEQLNSENRRLKYPLHFAIVDGFVSDVVKKLRKVKSEFEQKAGSRVVKNKLSTGNETVAGNGMVFED